MDNQTRAREAVRRAMAEKGLNNADITRATKLDKSTVGDFLSGERWPRPATLVRFDEALGWDAGTIDGIARGVIDPDVRPTDQTPEGVLLDIDLSDLPERDRELVVAAARLKALEVAREVRRTMGE